MPRKASPIILGDESRNMLMDLTQSGDVALAMRARMILMSADRPDVAVKDLADVLGTSDKTLRLWRTRYLENGIDGLLTVSTGGRPPKTMSPADLGAALETEMAADEERDWSAAELADRFSVSVRSVYNALSMRDSPLKRRRIWTYKTRDVLSSVGDHLLALYLSWDEQMIITGHTVPDLNGCAAYGSFVTQNSVLYEQLASSPGVLGVLDALVGATNLPEPGKRGLMPSIDVFTNNVLAEWSTERATVVDIYIHATRTPVLSRLSGVRLHHSGNVNDLVVDVIAGIGKTAGYEAIPQYQHVTRYVLDFMKVCRDRTIPFVWSLPYGDYQAEPDPVLPGVPVVTNVKSLTNLSSMLEDATSSLKPGSSMAVLIHKTESGESYCTPVVASQEIELDPNLDIRSFEGFKKTAHIIGKRAAFLSRDVNIADCKFEYETTKKECDRPSHQGGG